MATVRPASPEDCAECGFGGDLYSDEQVVGALPLAGAFLRGVLGGIDVELAGTRPDPGTWSILEHVDHIGHAARIGRRAADAARRRPGPDRTGDGRTGDGRPDAEPIPRGHDDLDGSVAAAGAESAGLGQVLKGLTPDEWTVTSVVPQGSVDQRWVGRHVLHEVLHHVHDVGRVRARLGDGVPVQTGAVTRIGRSDGGVPKTAVDRAQVTRRGLAGDRQHDRHHHGRPFQALCLYSADVIDALVAEGHPIAPGDAGENLTVSGLDWSTLRPGTIVALGEDVVVEVSCYAIPCAKNARWFRDGYFRRMLHDIHPGWSRLYATVLRPGPIRSGDPVVIEP